MKTPKHPINTDIILSVDRCLMSNHHGRIFVGFAATGPAMGLPEKIWRWIACPKPKIDKAGRPHVAPYALRKLEAALQNAGFNAWIIDPDYVPYYALHGAKALMIGHHDYFAFGPPSNEWWLLTGSEPVNRKSFIEFISNPAIWKAKKEKGLRIIVGGPAVWQWEAWPETREKWPIDTLVEGEADKAIVEIAEKIMNNEPLPQKITIPPSESPRIEEIPAIKRPSVCGLVEIMRGCPRGCRFCSVTLRPLRFMPLERIEKEARINLEAGVGGIVIHSEDILLYGADIVRPRREPLIRLHSIIARLLEEYNAGFAWSHASLAAIRYAEEHGGIVSEITSLVLDGDRRKYLGVEVGIETGSVELARRVMPAKAAPYRVEEWPETVEKAFQIMAENNIIPAATYILGLPGETEEDVYKTIELIDRLKPYPSLIVPMFFVPMGAFKDMEGFKRTHLKEYHKEAILAGALHSLHWAEKILEKGYLSKRHYFLLRILLSHFIHYAETRLERYARRRMVAIVERAGEKMKVVGEASLAS